MPKSVVTYENIKLNPQINMRYSCYEDHGSFVPMHWHESLEILYIHQGETILTIGQEQYPLSAGEFAIVDSNVIHSTRCESYSYCMLIQIPQSFLQQYMAEAPLSSFHLICSSCPEQYNAACQEAFHQLQDILKDFRTLWESQGRNYRLKYYSLILDLLYVIAENFQEDNPHFSHINTEKYIERLTLVKQFVDTHYREDISLKDISQYLALNEAYFSRFFKKYMHMTFLEYLNTVRLNHVYHDLISTDLPIQTILERNGFNNYKVFMRLFRHTYNCTPSAKRKEFLHSSPQGYSHSPSQG